MKLVISTGQSGTLEINTQESKRSDRQGHTVVGDPDMFSPYKKAWWSTRVDSHEYDCGNGFRMEGTVRNPVDHRQIESMVRAALNKKDPPMDMLYIYDHNGRRDLKMAAAVQSVIMEMCLTGRINCCTDPITSIMRRRCVRSTVYTRT